MIVNWAKPKAGVKIVPLANKNGEIEKNIVFLPGYNEVSEEDWNRARKHKQVQDYLKRGLFVEIGKVETVEDDKEVKAEDGTIKKEKEKKEIIKETPLGKLDPEKALEVVNDTFQIPTLEAWRKSESRDEIRAAIANQIEAINKGEAKGGSVNVGA